MRTENHGSVEIEEEELIGMVLKTLWSFGIRTFEPSEVVEDYGILKPPKKMGESVTKLARNIRYASYFWSQLHIPADKSQIKLGSSHLVTSRFVHNNWTVPEVIEYFVRSRQIERIRNEVLATHPDKPPKVIDEAISYSLYLVAKGWVVETQLNDLSDKYVKMGETHDKGGIDFINKELSGQFMDKRAMRQLRSWRHGYDIENGTKHDENGNKLLFWAWIHGELHTSEDWKALCDQKRVSITRKEMARDFEVEFGIPDL
jgi:hypothetical protein